MKSLTREQLGGDKTGLNPHLPKRGRGGWRGKAVPFPSPQGPGGIQSLRALRLPGLAVPLAGTAQRRGGGRRQRWLLGKVQTPRVSGPQVPLSLLWGRSCATWLLRVHSWGRVVYLLSQFGANIVP